MKIDIFANMLGVEWYVGKFLDKFREKIALRKEKRFFVYREGYALDKSGKIKEPSIYRFDRYFKKESGTGHSEFGSYGHDTEYEIFLTRESALEYANQVQKLFFEQKERDDIKKTQDELKLLRELAEKYNYTLIENQKGEK